MEEEEEEESLDPSANIVEENEPKKRVVMLSARQSNGLGGALSRVGTEYYMKDVQKVQPSEAQFYQGIIYIPWIVKPIWGLLTDVVPIFGYRRRPYFIYADSMGVISMLLLLFHEKLHLAFAVLSLTGRSAGVAAADVTIDACEAQNSINRPSRASDVQSLCALSSSIGALVGFSVSGIYVHLIGPKTVLVHVALSLNILDGMFYWYTDSKDGPGSVGSLLGAVLYQYVLKDHPFPGLALLDSVAL
ncbi:unnamed protein product [Prunus armeniaca]|uniref:Uncharacterized protein n=1 Tax=Prunus armeniaca TaxID=36596 RepID=A0A6J5TP94_PRUAR|nr:unnamed protein product [Prunus armeniaca]